MKNEKSQPPNTQIARQQPHSAPVPPSGADVHLQPAQEAERRTEPPGQHFEIHREVSGPIPSSNEMAGYKAVDPSLPVAIMEMAVSEARHRQAIELLETQNEHIEEMARIKAEEIEARGDGTVRILGAILPLFTVLAVLAVTCTLSYIGKKSEALALAGGMGGLYAAFSFLGLYNRRERKR